MQLFQQVQFQNRPLLLLQKFLLFQVFSQESEGLTKDFQGIGLGLALTKRYLDMNHVSISVESEKGLGSTFTLTFPGIPKPNAAADSTNQ